MAETNHRDGKADTGFRLMIAGGKTGGHLFPGIAVAQALLGMEPGAAVFFVGTGSAFETETLERYGFDHAAIVSSGIKGKGILGKITAAARIPVSLFQAGWLVRKFRPDLVLGVGGYSSGPVVLAARLLGIRTAIQEQNALPGVTNRILARFVHAIFTGFRETRGFPPEAAVEWVGNPVRIPEGGREPVSGEGAPRGRFTVLVTGGSQGASSINRALVEALGLLESPGSYRFLHQTGVRDRETVALAYEALGLEATVRAFFHDLPVLQEQADLIVCRAGAGTLAEITAKGKPSVLVPYPFAADDHQRFNAMALEDKGAAVMILDRDLSGSVLARTLEDLRKDPARLAAMAAKAGALGMPGAAETIARRCLALGRPGGN
jgi:UDP-N-acetylglucosamine--N-acetylmuramyl-(pentapeptide) pyrophosphoryl-undecaprenol N-acetylglucosamine transferase